MRIDLAIMAGRALRKVTQLQLAQRIGVPRPALSRWESGEKTPCPRNVERIARALDLSPRLFVEAAQETA